MTLANKPASEMTLLEHYAGIALQGLLVDGGEVHYDDYAHDACCLAARLIPELEKWQPKAEARIAELEAENAWLKNLPRHAFNEGFDQCCGLGPYSASAIKPDDPDFIRDLEAEGMLWRDSLSWKLLNKEPKP
jgi:hypothetical protein